MKGERNDGMSRRRLWNSLWCVCLMIWLILPAATSFAAQRPPAAAQAPAATAVPGVLLTAVSRDDAVLAGGISTGIRSPEGVATIEPIAWLTPDGFWQDLPCSYHWVTDADIARCRAFAASYLSRSHQYTIVSADGYGATIQAPPTKLTHCNAYNVKGLYSGAKLRRTALAVSNPAAFAPAQPLLPIEGTAYQRILHAFVAAAPVHLDTLSGIRLYLLQAGGHRLIVVERSFTDYASATPSVVPNVKFVFAIGHIVQGRFHILFWKTNTQEENEQLLGAIHLKNGGDFLVTSINSSEAQFFRIYALRNGSVQMVFSGGGSSC
jgi:hypothetical protein